MMIFTQLTSAFVLLTAMAAVLIAARVARLRWWRTEVGRQEALTAVIFMLVIGLAVAVRVFGLALPEPVRTVVWAAIATVFWGKLILIVRTQRGRPLPVSQPDRGQNDQHEA